jgi:hypothetical protein
MTKTFDKKCYELAELFLSDTGKANSDNTTELAILIQETIEDFISELEEDAESEDE